MYTSEYIMFSFIWLYENWYNATCLSQTTYNNDCSKNQIPNSAWWLLVKPKNNQNYSPHMTEIMLKVT